MIQANGVSSGGRGPRLEGFPHLTYAPAQWGEGVRIARNGATVESVRAAVAKSPAGTTTQEVADKLGVSLAEIVDALRYSSQGG